MQNYIRVARASDVPVGHCRVVAAGNRPIALFHVGESFYATDNTCPHHGGPLGAGSLEGQIVTCPWHGWMFDVITGVCPAIPNITVKSFPVRVEGGEIYLALEESV